MTHWRSSAPSTQSLGLAHARIHSRVQNAHFNECPVRNRVRPSTYVGKVSTAKRNRNKTKRLNPPTRALCDSSHINDNGAVRDSLSFFLIMIIECQKALQRSASQRTMFKQFHTQKRLSPRTCLTTAVRPWVPACSRHRHLPPGLKLTK